MIISSNRDVKVLEAKPGGKTSVVDYKFDTSKKILTIKKEGASAITVHAEDYIPSKTKGFERPAQAAISLPPGVAQVVGFKRAVPVSALAK